MFRPIRLAATLALSAPALAGNTLVAGGPVAVAKSTLTVAPDGEWNRLGFRPGALAETWTLDGKPLNDLTFYGGVPDGKPILREVSRKARPLPRFAATMLLSDVPTLFEQSYRIAFDTPLMEIGATEPVAFAGAKGVRFAYSFTRPGEDVRRQGEARAAIIAGKLYMISFEAPALHFFDASVERARKVMASAALSAGAMPAR